MTADLKVVELDTPWQGEIQPDDLLDMAKEWEDKEHVLIICTTTGGGVSGGATRREVGEILLMLERFKLKLVSGDFSAS